MQHTEKIVAEVLESVRLDHRTSIRHRSSELNSSRMNREPNQLVFSDCEMDHKHNQLLTNYDEFNHRPNKIIKTMDRFNESSK